MRTGSPCRIHVVYQVASTYSVRLGSVRLGSSLVPMGSVDRIWLVLSYTVLDLPERYGNASFGKGTRISRSLNLPCMLSFTSGRVGRIYDADPLHTHQVLIPHIDSGRPLRVAKNSYYVYLPSINSRTRIFDTRSVNSIRYAYMWRGRWNCTTIALTVRSARAQKSDNKNCAIYFAMIVFYGHLSAP